MQRISFFTVAAVLALAGCTNLAKEGYQKIVVDTPGVINAECYLETETNKFIVMTPRPVSVERSSKPLMVTCQKAGYHTATVTVESKVDAAWLQLNVFNGVVPGTAYDVASNAIYEYPNVITVVMEKAPAVQLPEREPFVLKKKETFMPPPPPPTKAEEVKTEKKVSEGLKK